MSVALDVSARRAAEELHPRALEGLEKAGLVDVCGVERHQRLDPSLLQTVFADAVGEEFVDEKGFRTFAKMIEASCVGAKRRRRMLAVAPAEVAYAWAEPPSQRQTAAGPASGDPLPPAPAGQLGRWPTRLPRNMALSVGTNALLQTEERERDRWAQEIIKILKADHFPIVKVADGAVNPDAILKRTLGGRRGRTLRTRCRTWRRVRDWLLHAGYPSFPTGAQGARHLIEYLEEIARADCKRTVPRSVVAALTFFETCGAVPKEVRASECALVHSAVKDLERELALGSARLKKKAPQFPTVVIMALEATVTNLQIEPYKRLFAWVKLVRIWAAMRFDDSMHVKPQSVELKDGNLELIIHSTKTTGAGKKVELVFAHVAKDAYLFSRAWLSTGHQLFVDLTGDLVRDYFLPLPSRDFMSVRAGPVLYADSLSMTRALLKELKGVAIVGQAVAEAETRLMHADASSFWSEHSDRSQLVSWASCCGLARSAMEVLGRWRPSTSVDYIRTSKEAVLGIQGDVAAKIRSGTRAVDLLGEESLFTNLQAHLLSRGWEADAAKAQIAMLRFFPAAAVVDDLIKEIVLEAGKIEADVAVAPLARQEAFTDPEGIAVDELEAPRRAPALSDETKYVISITVRVGARCLHKVDGCGRKPGIDNFRFEEVTGDLDPASYDKVCQQCWRRPEGRPQVPAPEAGAEGGNEVSDSESSSSSSTVSSA